jgi:hypothetical protein
MGWVGWVGGGYAVDGGAAIYTLLAYPKSGATSQQLTSTEATPGDLDIDLD